MKTSVCLFLTIITLASVAVAQQKTEKIEVGVQQTLLTFYDPGFPDHLTKPGLGGRVTYNFNDSVAAEAEINFFRQVSPFFTDSNAYQAQFGIKIGKRFEKFGVFAKVRPGFLSVDKVQSIQPNSVVLTNPGILIFPKIARTNYFTIDTGAVLEFYPSKRPVLRFEAGDTLIRHPTLYDFAFTTPLSVQVIRPAQFNHNFQFTAGIGIRLGNFPSGDDDVKTHTRERTPRYELGAQFTLLHVFPVTNAAPCPDCLTSDTIQPQPGFGGRFSFNLTDDVALEAEGNFYTRDVGRLPNPSGHMFQGQFGAKIGKRFEKWGAFGKVRPGFVGFTKVNKLISERAVVNNLVIPAIAGEFAVGKELYPSVDLGGVVEFYISRRWVARFDAGDTIIRYSVLPVATFSARFPIFKRPPETHHNLQLTSGVAFRF